MFKLNNLFSIIIFVLLVSMVPVLGQNCPITNITTTTDVIVVERAMTNCGDQFATWENELTANLQNTSLPTTTATLNHLFLGLIDSENQEHFLASQHYQLALVTSSDTNTEPLRHYAYYYYGITLLERSGKIQTTLDNLESALSTGISVNDPLIVGRVYQLKGQFSEEDGLMIGARDNYMLALEQYLKVPTISIPEQIVTLRSLSRMVSTEDRHGMANLYRDQATSLERFPNLYDDFLTEPTPDTIVNDSCNLPPVFTANAYLIFDNDLRGCPTQIALLRTEIETLLSDATDDIQRAHLQVTSGLLAYAIGDFLDAHTIHGRALLIYQDFEQVELQVLVAYFMARSYEQRNGQDSSVRTYYDLAIRNGDAFPYIQVLAQLAYGRYLLNETTEYIVSADLLETAHETFNALPHPEISIELEREMLILLERVALELGRTEQANGYARRLADLSSDSIREVTETTNVSQYNITTCETNTLYGIYDILIADRIMRACSREQLATLILTAQAIKYSDTNLDDQILGEVFYGIGQYIYGNLLEAQLELGSAILTLNEFDLYGIRGATYIYLIRSYNNDNKIPESQRFYPNAEESLENRTDVLSLYYIHELNTMRGDLLFDEDQLEAAAEQYELAFRFIEASTIPSRNQSEYVVSRLIRIFRRLPNSNVDTQRWQDELDRINSGETSPPLLVATPFSPPSGSPIIDCSVDIFVALNDLVVIDESLSRCSNNELGSILSAVERDQFRVGDDVARELFFLNYEALIYYYRKDYRTAQDVQDDALVVANNNIVDPIQKGLTYYFYARIRFERDQEDAFDYLIEADRSTSSNDDIIAALIYDITGTNAISEGRPDAGVTDLSRAVELYDVLNYSSRSLSLQLFLGDLALERSDFASAHEFYNGVLDRNPSDPILGAQALIGNVRYFKYHGNYALAEMALDQLNDLDLPPNYQAITTAEWADVSRLQFSYVEAESILETLNQDRHSLSCEIQDLISLYYGYYLSDIGDRANALRILTPILSDVGCVGRDAVMISRVYNAVSDAYLQFGIANRTVREAVDNAAEFSQIANDVNNYNLRGSYPRGYQLSYIHRARFNISLGPAYYDTALENLQVTEAYAHEWGDERMLAEVDLVRVDIALKRGLLNDAVTHLNNATEHFIVIEHDTAALETLERAIQIYLSQGNYARVQEFIAEAEVGEGTATLPLAFRGLVTFYHGQAREQQGFTTDAATLYTEARRLFEDANDSFNVYAVDLQSIRLAHRVGDYDGALERINTLVTIIDGLIETSISDSNIDALTLLRSQVDLLDGDNKLLRWLDDPVLQNETVLLRAQGNYLDALEGFTAIANLDLQSSTRCQGVPIDSRVAEAHNRLGALRVAVLQYNFARSVRPNGNQDLDLAICIYDELGNDSGRSDARYNLGRYLLFADNTEDYTDAISFFQTALSLTSESDPYRRAQIYTHIGLAYEYQIERNNTFDLENAISAYENASNLLSFAYAEIGDADRQRTFGFRNQTLIPYNRLILLYADNPQLDNHAENALLYAEQSRARSYLTNLQGTNTQLNIGDENARHWLEVRSEIANLQIQRDVADAGSASNLQTQIDNLVIEISQLEQSLDNSILNQLLTVSVANAARIDSSITPDTAIVSYYIVKDNVNRFTATTNVMIFVVTNPDGEDASDNISVSVTMVPIINENATIEDIGQSDCNEELETLAYCAEIRVPIAQIQNSSATIIMQENIHQQLYNWLIDPVETQIDGYNNIVFVPHNDLHYLPFEILQDSENTINTDGNPVFLFDEFESISYIPSITVYTLLQDIQARPERENALLLGYSGEAYGETPLQSIGDEIDNIRPYFYSYISEVGNNANRDFLTDALDYNVIHMAAHGLFNPLDPLASEILLAPYFSEDGDSFTFAQLTVRDIYDLSLQDTNPLVVISACQVGNNQINPGDELEGFTRAFLISGARGIVSSLWNISDSRAADFVEIFYRHRFEGMTNAEALTSTKRTMRDEYPNEPQTWFAFIISGRLD